MKNGMTVGVLFCLTGSALADSPAFTIYANQILVKARATKAPCEVVLGAALAKSLYKSLGSHMLCATTKYEKDDTKDFIDINFNDSMRDAWEDGKNFTNGLFTFDDDDNALGVILFNDSKQMLVFDVLQKK